MKPIPSVSIIDYGVGNVNSVANMLRRAGVVVKLVRTSAEVLSAQKLLLPGVGSFDDCKRALAAVPGLESAITKAARSGRPLLGICVGMQLLAASSEEGKEDGLNIIPGRVRKFSFPRSECTLSLTVPHMAWSSVQSVGDNALFGQGLADLNRFYFVHSYYFEASNSADVSAWCKYGFDFAASVRKGNVYGVQFHPEKSHRFGLQLLKNFAEIPSL